MKSFKQFIEGTKLSDNLLKGIKQTPNLSDDKLKKLMKIHSKVYKLGK